MRQGLDYAWGYHGGAPAVFKKAGYSFVVRYLSGGRTKDLTLHEAQELRAVGLDIALVWEAASASRALAGYGAGTTDARLAVRQATSLGMPEGRPIYFAVDFDATSAQTRGPVREYFRGIAAVLPLSQIGVYAGLRPLFYLFDQGLIKWGWQTYAWSGGTWDGRAQLHQYRNGVWVAGIDCDKDRAITEDFGQWGYEEDDMVDPKVQAQLDRIEDKVGYAQNRALSISFKLGLQVLEDHGGTSEQLINYKKAALAAINRERRENGRTDMATDL